MNSLERARISSYGNYSNGTVLKSPKINIKNTNPERGASVLNNFLHRPRGTRLSNNQPSTNNIAIYDREPHELMLNETVGNEMFVKLRNNNKSKIRTLNEDMIPNTGMKYEIEKFGLDDPKVNKNPYYPHLNISQYNQIPKDIKPTMIDSRILQFTQERDFNYESDQVENAKVLLNDNRRWDKINRQNEADRHLLGLGSAMDNWVDNKNAYVARSSVPTEFVVEEIHKKLDNHIKYDQTKDELLINNVEAIEKDSLHPANQFYDVRLSQKGYNHIYSGNNDMILNRYMNNNDYSVNKPEYTKQRKNDNLFKTISNTVLKMFRKETKEPSVNNHPIDKQILQDSDVRYIYDENNQNYSSYYNRKDNIQTTINNDLHNSNILAIKNENNDIDTINEKYTERNRNLINRPENTVSFSRFNLV